MVEVKDEDDLTDEVQRGSTSDEVRQGSTRFNVVMQGVPATETRLEEIKRHQLEDEICREITKYVREGWPEKERLKGLFSSIGHIKHNSPQSMVYSCMHQG